MPDPVDIFALPLGPLQANCFIVVTDKTGLVIDPGDEAHVLVRIGAGWQAVPVPGGEASKVTAVQVTPGGAVKVQKNNATLDTV